MQSRIGDAALTDVEDRRERREARRRMDDDAAGEIEHAVRLQNSPAPHHVRDREINEQQPGDEKQQIRLERHAVGERAGDQAQA